jgi:hypothetical protein
VRRARLLSGAFIKAAKPCCSFHFKPTRERFVSFSLASLFPAAAYSVGEKSSLLGTMTQSAKRDKSGDRTERLTSARDNGSESRGTSDRLGARRVQAWRSRKSAMF